MSQFIRPNSNITLTGVNAGDYTSIDESTRNDSDFIIGTNNTNVTIEVGLDTPTNNPADGTCTVRFVHAQGDHDTSPFAPASQGTAFTSVTCLLLEGTTTIASSGSLTNSASWVERSFTFNASSISAWSNLRLRFTITGAGGATANRRTGAISWAEVEVPDPGATLIGFWMENGIRTKV